VVECVKLGKKGVAHQGGGDQPALCGEGDRWPIALEMGLERGLLKTAVQGGAGKKTRRVSAKNRFGGGIYPKKGALQGYGSK